ncbi:MAG: hypothetical protein AAFQ82_27675, partial [Myxococcota bacterium]
MWRAWLIGLLALFGCGEARVDVSGRLAAKAPADAPVEPPADAPSDADADGSPPMAPVPAPVPPPGSECSDASPQLHANG